MTTSVALEGTKFLINGRPTYEGRSYRGRSIEGLLFNSRMVQAIFDDACEETRARWVYPDTGAWDPERNTSEFCAMLPVYRAHGLLAVTVGLQGGGSMYTPEVYDRYENSAFAPDGTMRQAYLARLMRLISAADDAGIVVIVNYFYWKQVHKFVNDEVPFAAAERATAFLVASGHQNVMIDVANESNAYWNYPALEPGAVHRLIDTVRNTTLGGRRFLVGCSTSGGGDIPAPRWLAAEDITLPHGNSCGPEELRDKLRRIREMDAFKARPRPLLVNEDGIDIENMEAATDEYASWGFYAQGAGSGADVYDRVWPGKEREARFEDLSGFQTVPVNWSINTIEKRRFFGKLREVTSGEMP